MPAIKVGTVGIATECTAEVAWYFRNSVEFSRLRVHLFSPTFVCSCRDDAVFDDSLVELFPRYWEMTPRDFDFVFVGHILPGDPVREPTVDGEAASLQP